MSDSLETKAVKRLMRWISMLSVLVATPIPEGGKRAAFPDPYSAALMKRMLDNYAFFQKTDFGFGLLNDKSLEGIFLNLLFFAEMEMMPWGRALQHLVSEDSYNGVRRLSRLPFILLPQECVVTGKDLQMTRSNYNSRQGHSKGHIKLVEAKDGWKPMQKKLRAAFEASLSLDGIRDREALLAKHRENFSVFWSAYKVLVEKLESPYTPRYLLFKECQDIEFNDIFVSLFFDRVGRDVPIDSEGMPHMFDASLVGKRISDFENASGEAVDALGRLLGPNFITLKQLDDYFIYQ